MKRHIFGGICQVLFRKKWGDFSYEQRKSLEKSRLRIPRRYIIWGGILTCIFILIIFTKFIGIEKHFVKRSRTMEIRVSFENAKSLNHFISELTSCECNVVYCIVDI